LKVLQTLDSQADANLALDAAEKLGVEFVFFLNNDSTVTPSTLGALVSASDSLRNNTVLGSVVRYLDRYEARVSRARELYRQACEESADLPVFQRTSAEAVAFTALESVQQDAMREFVASEFAELFNLRRRILARKRYKSVDQFISL
jgi:hypothetical protein